MKLRASPYFGEFSEIWTAWEMLSQTPTARYMARSSRLDACCCPPSPLRRSICCWFWIFYWVTLVRKPSSSPLCEYCDGTEWLPLFLKGYEPDCIRRDSASWLLSWSWRLNQIQSIKNHSWFAVQFWHWGHLLTLASPMKEVSYQTGCSASHFVFLLCDCLCQFSCILAASHSSLSCILRWIYFRTRSTRSYWQKQESLVLNSGCYLENSFEFEFFIHFDSFVLLNSALHSVLHLVYYHLTMLKNLYLFD